MGIWFHEGKERENISNVLRQVIRSYTEVKAEDTSTHDTSTREKINYNQAVSNLLSSLRIGANTAEEKETVTPSQSKVQQTEQRTDTKESAVLDKKSLQLALLSLLQDDRFIDIIHGQYLKVVQVRSAKSQQNERDKK
jgi:mRNA-decapping enzyme 1B